MATNKKSDFYKELSNYADLYKDLNAGELGLSPSHAIIDEYQSIEEIVIKIPELQKKDTFVTHFELDKDYVNRLKDIMHQHLNVVESPEALRHLCKNPLVKHLTK